MQKNYGLILISLLVLRVLIGLHFYNEGISKIRSGSFSCVPFLSQANGPFADSFTKILDDHNGHLRLCLVPHTKLTGPLDDNTPDAPRTDQPVKLVIDTSKTFAIWEDFTERAMRPFDGDSEQVRQAEIVLGKSKRYLSDFLNSNEDEILAWASGRSRLNGFLQDGEFRKAAADQVTSLKKQIGAIRSDLGKTVAPWYREVESTWDELEARINRIGGNRSEEDFVSISRPYRQAGSRQDLINRYLPWFDTVVGCLLILGLFTRFACLGGMGLLLGVVMTQPFWVPGSVSTFNQWIEFGGLLVLFSTTAGQFGGLDYFVRRRRSSPDRIEG